MKKIVMLIIIGILIFPVYYFHVDVVSSDSGTAYYVANDGDDSNTGTSTSDPWKTIGKVNTALGDGTISQGDDIYFKRGDTWSEDLGVGRDSGLDVQLGGTESNYMVIGAYGTGAKPVINNINSGDSGCLTCDDSLGNVTIKNLNFTGGNTGEYALVYFTVHADYENIYFDNIDVYNSGEHGIFLYRINRYKIENSFSSPNSGGSAIVIYGHNAGTRISNGTIRNCTLSNCKDGISMHFGDSGGEAGARIGNNHWVENVTIYNSSTSEEAIDIVGGIGCENIVVENCKIYDSGNVVIGHGVSNVLFRNNYIYNMNDPCLTLTKSNNTIVRNNVIQNWTSNKKGIVLDSAQYSPDFRNITIYNNDVITYGKAYPLDVAGSVVSYSLIFKNNIFYSTEQASPGVYVRYLDGGNLSNKNSNFDCNIWWRGDELPGNHWYMDGDLTNYNWAGWSGLSETYNELRANASIFNPTGNNFPSDFELNSDSPCIDAGDWLTTANGGGTGTTITVDEANYFFAGISRFGVSGDNIFVGDDTNLEITNVDYANNQITVNHSITWNNGEYVSLSSYRGSKPDIGAFEFRPICYAEISNVTLTESNPLDTDPNFGWINITSDVTADAGVSNVKLYVYYPDSSSVNVSMNAGETNSYYYNTSTIFSDYGTYSYYIWAVDSNGNQSTSNVYYFSMPPNWDIDKNGVCNVIDLLLISNHYNETGQNGWIREDVDNNGIVQLLDLLILIDYYNKTW